TSLRWSAGSPPTCSGLRERRAPRAPADGPGPAPRRRAAPETPTPAPPWAATGTVVRIAGRGGTPAAVGAGLRAARRAPRAGRRGRGGGGGGGWGDKGGGGGPGGRGRGRAAGGAPLRN